MQNESISGWNYAQSASFLFLEMWSECEHTCWDPKDGELYLSTVKLGETLVEAGKDSDVQIDLQTWV